jgi:DNA-binding NarL/FixJ family response regulator
MSYSVLIVDDSAPIRASLRFCIEQDTDWAVCGEAENGKVAVQKVLELHPNIVILDLQMPVMNGLEAARLITGLAPNTVMLMFTLYESQQVLREAQAAGIHHVVSKSTGFAGILSSLSKAFRSPRRSRGALA